MNYFDLIGMSVVKTLFLTYVLWMWFIILCVLRFPRRADSGMLLSRTSCHKREVAPTQIYTGIDADQVNLDLIVLDKSLVA